MKLDHLSLKEHLLLARRAELRCAERLLELSSRIDPPDADLSRRLRGMVLEEESHDAELSRFDAAVPWPLVWRLDERAIGVLLEGYLPTLCRNDGTESEGPDEVRRKVSAIEDESVWFYRTLEKGAQDEGAKALFRGLAEREAAHKPV